MKICAFSDMHGQYDFKVEPCDIVLICGDIVPLKIQKYTQESEEWIKTCFIPWCNNLPCDKVIFIAGNHDFYFERHPDRIKRILEGQDKIVYLDCETYEYKGKIIYGTPWCHQFYNWSFMTSDVELEKIYNKIPYKVDILLTHDCPHGTSDVILQDDVSWYDGKTHIGCIPLGNAVDEKKPQIQFVGHLHSCTKEPQQRGETMVINVSVVNEHYKRVYEPHYIEI